MTQTEAHAATLPSDVARIPYGAPVSEVVRFVERDGGVVLTGAISRAQVDAINRDLDEAMGPLRQGNFDDGDANALGDFFGHRTKRLQHCLRFSKTYRDAYFADQTMAEYLSATIPGKAGNHFLYSSHAIEIFPGEKAQDLHRDGGGLMNTLGISRPDSVNLLINTILALTDITEEMGATRVIPGSHLWEDYSTPGAQEQTIPLTMNAGDMFFFNCKVLHGGGANITKDRSRRVISTAFSVAFIIGEEAWPFAIPIEEVRTYPPMLQRFMGFRSLSYKGEEPGFLWRVETRPLEEHLGL